ncbi:MAG: glycosyltransferase family 25 protein [Pseudomonadota bacterium]
MPCGGAGDRLLETSSSEGNHLDHWPIYLINLDRDVARLEAATGELARAGLGWTRIPAVNGRALTPDEIAAVYDANANRRWARHPLTAPEIGCYLSHLRAWDTLRASGAPGAVVLEDDMRITGDLVGVLAALAQDTGAWDLVKLYTFRPDVRLLKPRPLTAGHRIATPYRVPSTTLGYAIRTATAERLLRSARPFFRPIDEDHKFFWQNDLRVALVDPAPLAMGLQDASDGTIGETRRAANRASGRGVVGRLWQNARYQAGYAVGLHLRRLTER